jgi:CHAD domain-containing protein
MNESPTATVGPYLTAKLRSLDERLGQVALRVLSPTHDGEAVHDLRVALRRTRTVLEVARSTLGGFRSDEVRGALRDLQRATSALRDEEVFLDLLGSLPMDDPSMAAWMKSRREHERRLRRALVRRIEAGELDRARRLLDALLAFRVDPSRDKRLAKSAQRAVAQARRGVERRRTGRIDDPQALHRLRIAYKRLRYTVEIFGEALPSDLAALAQPASRLQNRLGAVHDADVGIGYVRRARKLSPEARHSLLAALEKVRAERMIAYAREAAPLAYASRSERANGKGAPDPHAVGTAALRKTSTR